MLNNYELLTLKINKILIFKVFQKIHLFNTNYKIIVFMFYIFLLHQFQNKNKHFSLELKLIYEF